MPAPTLSDHLDRFAANAYPDQDLPEPDRVAATNRIMESLLAVQAPEPPQAILAARITAAHLAMLECLRRAMRDGVGEGVRADLRAKAALMPQVIKSFMLSAQAEKGPVPYLDDILAWDPRAGTSSPLELPDDPDFFLGCDPMPGEDAEHDGVGGGSRGPRQGLGGWLPLTPALSHEGRGERIFSLPRPHAR